MATTHKFKVEMTCEGCSGAVTRVLNKTEGVENFRVELQDKEVFVTTDLPADKILQVLQKTGKETTYIGTV